MTDWMPPWLTHSTTLKVIAVLGGLLVIRLLVTFSRRAIAHRLEDQDLRHQSRKLVNSLGYLVAFALVAVVFSKELSGLTVILGVATAGIAFALQEVIVSVAGWLAIMLGYFYKTGDRVQLGGIVGDVIDIGVLRTTLMECGGWVNGDLYNGRIVRIANSFVFREPVFNYSAHFPFLWDEFKVPVKYGSDHRLAQQLLEEAARAVVGEHAVNAKEIWSKLQSEFLVENAETAPMVTMTFNDNWIEFTVRYVVEYKKRRSTRDHLSRLILDEIAETDGRVALASATFHLVEAPSFQVQLRKGP